MRRDEFLKLTHDKFFNPVLSGNCDSGFTWQSIVIPDTIYTQANFLLSTDPNGTPLWGMLVEGNYYEGNQHVTSNRYNELVVAGRYFSDSIFIAGRKLNVNGSMYIAQTGVVSSVYEGLQRLNEMVVYPNPTSDKRIMISSPEFTSVASCTVDVYDMMGRIIHAAKYTVDNKTIVVDFKEKLQPGMYHLLVKQGSFIAAQKLVVN